MTTPRTLARVGEAAHEPGGIDPRAMRRVRAGEEAGNAYVGLDLRWADEPQIVLREPARPLRLEPGAEPIELRPARRDPVGARLHPAAVDRLALDRCTDPVDPVDHRALRPDHVVHPGSAAVDACLAGDAGRDEATVAARRSVADGLGLDDGDAQARVVERQCVRGPEAGVAGADDRDVRVVIARRVAPAA